MQKVSNKVLMAGMLAAVVGVTGIATIASAKSEQRGSHLSGRERSLEAKLHRSERGEHAFKMHKRSIPGKVTSITDTTLVIRKGKRDFTVTTSGTTTYVNRKWQPIVRTDIKVGDKVTVKGTVTGLTVEATVVRDVSLPAKTTDTNDNN